MLEIFYAWVLVLHIRTICDYVGSYSHLTRLVQYQGRHNSQTPLGVRQQEARETRIAML